jgi:hypothetical protein
MLRPTHPARNPVARPNVPVPSPTAPSKGVLRGGFADAAWAAERLISLPLAPLPAPQSNAADVAGEPTSKDAAV